MADPTLTAIGWTPMPHYQVGIQGDAPPALGLLAKVGIQNVVNPEELPKRVTARLFSDSAKSARGRVLAALIGEPFTVESAYVEG